ncbi:hypothetical protein N7508_003904 [Penicillium antarcticum]|uniref:uncharacterized protein n=1 Tax=Penicillium antarcticum TaxID=416450 RepID=UPI00238F0138|nr:uncharacterized protein N7508_003904 [Penicillium antarcticum]KAJ5313074.1 hypothetical protein N7508_003904 [Penicillium antarcticum]
MAPAKRLGSESPLAEPGTPLLIQGKARAPSYSKFPHGVKGTAELEPNMCLVLEKMIGLLRRRSGPKEV